MKYIKLLILLPTILLADTLSEQEIDKLVEHAFYSDFGYTNKNQDRWNEPIHIFINPLWDRVSPNRVKPTTEEFDEIVKVATEINQLTGINYIIHEEHLDLKQIQGLVKNKPVGHIRLYFVPSAKYMSTGMQAEAVSSRNFARIYINTYYRKSNNQEHQFVLHNIREEMTNAIGLAGDTFSGVDKYSALEGSANHFAIKYSEMDRRGIYAYYAMDKEGPHSAPPNYSEPEFRKKISKVKIDHEAVYQGAFKQSTVSKPKPIIEKDLIKIAKQALPTPEPREKIAQAPKPKIAPRYRHNASQEKVGWIYFNTYPWVYSHKDNSWYYMLPREQGMFVWSQLTKKWSKMSDVFGIN